MGELFVLFWLGSLFLAPVLTIVAMVLLGRRLARLQPYRAFAMRTPRRLLSESSAIAASPFVIFELGSHRIRLAQVGSVRRQGLRIIECRIPVRLFAGSPSFFLEARSNSFLLRDVPDDLTGREQANPLAVDDEAFANTFIVVASNERQGAKLLDARLRFALRQLEELFRQPGASFSFDGTWAAVRKVCAIDNAMSLEHLFQVAGLIFDAMLDHFGAPPLLLEGRSPEPHHRLAQAANTRVVEVAGPDEIALLPAEPAGRLSVCQVCGGEVEASDCVWCTVCYVPLHRDCAEYNGCCTTYGCTSTTFGARPV